MTHSPEPWIYCKGHGIHSAVNHRGPRAGKTEYVADVASDDVSDKKCDVNAKRIVACVNFCRDIPTEWMQGKVAKTIQVSPNERPEDGWRYLADIPDLLGLIPVCKEPSNA